MIKNTKVFNVFLTLRNNISTVLGLIKPISNAVETYFKKTLALFERPVNPSNPPRLRPVQIVEYLSFDDIAFARGVAPAKQDT